MQPLNDRLSQEPNESRAGSRRLVDTKEVAVLLGCSWGTVLRHADSGKIPFGVKLGGLRRWGSAELDAFIANGCKPPGLKKRRP